MPVAYIFPILIENTTSILTMDEDLHVFIPNELNLDKSIGHFINLYSLRSRTNREYWLLDVSYWSSVNDAINDLEDLQLDLDDDLFLYFSTKRTNNAGEKNNHELFSIWEFYEIHPTLPRKILQYGNWSSVEGLALTKVNKWVRRRNLEVHGAKMNVFFLKKGSRIIH